MIKFIVLFACLLSLPAYAYLGPGMGGGVIAAILGFIAAFFFSPVGNSILSHQKSYKSEKG